MKKTITPRRALAGAALAAAAAANAQTNAAAANSLTVYGVADACVVNYAAANGARWQSNGGGCFYGSRLGFRGTEDLGGGLRVYFILEGGLTLDNGSVAQGGRAWGRKSLVGTGGSLGAIEAGRDYAPAFYLLTAIDPVQLGIGSALATIWSGSVGTASGRVDNALAYLSPEIAGFTLRVQIAPGELQAPSSSRGGDTKGVNLFYRNGGLLVSAAYANVRNAAGDAADSATTVGAKFDFGTVSLAAIAQSGGWEGTRTAAAPASATALFSRRFNSYLIGGTVKFGLPSVSATYKRYDDRTASNFDAEVWSLVGIYPLSKRTQLYAGTSRLKNKRASSYGAADGNGAYTGVAPGGSSRPLDIGFTHFF